MVIVTRLTVIGSTVESPVSKEVRVPVAQVFRVRAKLPAVTAGEIGFRLSRDGARFAPSPFSDAGWITNLANLPDTVEWEEEQFLTGREGKLRVEAYNTTAGTLDIEVRLSTSPHLTDPKLIAVLDRLADNLPAILAAESEVKPAPQIRRGNLTVREPA